MVLSTVIAHKRTKPATPLLIAGRHAFLSFGLGPSAGVYGACADAANDIMRAEGIGPIIKWVDDWVFLPRSKGILDPFQR
jgi:hypothetical protein